MMKAMSRYGSVKMQRIKEKKKKTGKQERMGEDKGPLFKKYDLVFPIL